MNVYQNQNAGKESIYPLTTMIYSDLLYQWKPDKTITLSIQVAPMEARTLNDSQYRQQSKADHVVSAINNNISVGVITVKMFLSGFSIFIVLIAESTSVWIGEEYWTRVYTDGSIENGRTEEDFLTFDATYQGAPVQNAYIAYLITNDTQGHYEIFGQAYMEGDRVCGRFVARNGQRLQTCGGFRVLSYAFDDMENNNPFQFVVSEYANPHSVVEYRDKQIALIVSWRFDEAQYGSANMERLTAEAVGYRHNVIKVSHINDPIFFNKRVFLLVKLQPNEQYESAIRESPSATNNDDDEGPIYHTPNERHYNYFNSGRERVRNIKAWQFFDMF